MACKQNLAPAIAAEAARQGVPSSIALAVAQVESGTCQWRADGSTMVSSEGAIGVMQVEPGSAGGLDLYDVNQNIQAGVAYLRQMYSQFGTWPRAAAAYNWGPGNLQRALASSRPIPASVARYVEAVTGTDVAEVGERTAPAPAAGDDNGLTWAVAGGAAVLLAWLLA